MAPALTGGPQICCYCASIRWEYRHCVCVDRLRHLFRRCHLQSQLDGINTAEVSVSMSQCMPIVLYGKFQTSRHAPAAKATQKVSSVAFWMQEGPSSHFLGSQACECMVSAPGGWSDAP